MASSSLPGLLPPRIKGHDLLVDGCVLNNLPGDLMNEKNKGPVFTVNVNPKEDLRLERAFTDYPSPWKILSGKMNPFGESANAPLISSIMARASMLASISQSNQVAKEADYYLEPPITQYGILDFHAIDEIVKTGYRYAMEKMAEWMKEEKFCKILRKSAAV